MTGDWAASRFLAHDLLRVDAGMAFRAGAPQWAATSVAKVPWVVVRRAPASDGTIPIGIRGRARNERHGDRIGVPAVRERLSPEALLPRLAQYANDLSCSSAAPVPAMALAHALLPIFARHGLTWGPTGSVGFELASGVATASATSDLDLIVRCLVPWSRMQARLLLEELRQCSGAKFGNCRIDAVVEVPSGAFALAEYASCDGPVLLRTTLTPRLVLNPWHDLA